VIDCEDACTIVQCKLQQVNSSVVKDEIEKSKPMTLHGILFRQQHEEEYKMDITSIILKL
jgi:hypothetical protein